jgi:ATP-dependent exoDNAse (exonuclease V) beta subunit
METGEAKRAIGADRRERLRLLYVGFTRARDLLVLAAGCSSKKGPATASLDLLVDADDKRLLSVPFEDAPGASEVAVAKRRWRCGVRALSGLPPVAAAPARPVVRWYAPAPRTERPRERLNPSAEPLAASPSIVRVEKLGGRHAVQATAEQAGPVGDAIHAFLAADHAAPAEARLAMATRILRSYRVVGAVAPETLLAASDSLRTWLDARYPGAVWFREWPVRARLAGPSPRLLVGEVDLFLELPDAFVLVDHKSFPGAERERDRRVVEEYAPQLAWYARVLGDALRKPLRAAYVHLPIRGEMAEVRLAPPGSRGALP